MNVGVWDVKLTEVLPEKTEKGRYSTALMKAEILFSLFLFFISNTCTLGL